MKKAAILLALTSIFLLSPFLFSLTEAQGNYYCNSCYVCSEYLRGGSLPSGDILILTVDITSQDGNCIEFGGADNITFDCNGHTISGSDYGYGIWLNDSDGGSNNNTITDCTSISYFQYGLYLEQSDNNTITSTTISENNLGIHLQQSDSNTITSITASGNDLGIHLDYSGNNLIYNNYFNNTNNFRIESSPGNHWNTSLDCSSGTNIIGDSCIGGNYWTDYDGYNFSDECTDSDGDDICDIPHALAAGNQDELPLVWDKLAPSLQFVFPTPPDTWESTTRGWIYVNVSVSEVPDTCLLDWNGTNETMSIDGTTCYLNKTSIDNGELAYLAYANDSRSNLGNTPTRTAKLNISDAIPPVIDNYEIFPPAVFPGDDILIGVNASDNLEPDDSIGVYVNITYPNGTYLEMTLVNHHFVPWNMPVSGTYQIAITAEDTSSRSATFTDNFTVGIPFELELNFTDFDDEGISLDLEIDASGTDYLVWEDHESDGEFNT